MTAVASGSADLESIVGPETASGTLIIREHTTIQINGGTGSFSQQTNFSLHEGGRTTNYTFPGYIGHELHNQPVTYSISRVPKSVRSDLVVDEITHRITPAKQHVPVYTVVLQEAKS